MARRRETTAEGSGALRCAPRDSVDALLASWGARRPDLDFSPVSVISRLGRVRGHIDTQLDDVFAAHGLNAPTFGVLVTLARVDDGGGVSQRRLMDELGLTSGTVSVRMDRLVSQGLVDRRPDPRSARNTLIQLTDRGRELFERVVPSHLANEQRLLSALSPQELELLADLLRKMLVEFEGARPPAERTREPGTHAGSRLRRRRTARGRRPAAGDRAARAHRRRGGPGEQAGLRTGDVLTSSGTHELRAVADLYVALHDARASGELRLRVIRGIDEHRVTVPLHAASVIDGTRAATSGRGGSGEHRV